MSKFERFLYHYGILRLSEDKLEKWEKKGQIEKLLFAAENGMFNIRLKCVKLLSNRIANREVKSLLINMISDDVEIVSETAIKSLEPSMTSKLSELIQRIGEERKVKKRKEKRMKSHISNIQFKGSRRVRPGVRLTNTLAEQQKANQPPSGV